MKKWMKLAFLIFCCLTLLPLAHPFAGAEEGGEIRIGWVLPDPEIVDPRSMRRYYASYLNEIAKYTDWRYQLVALEADDSIDALETGEVDLLLPMEYNPVRAAQGMVYSASASYYDIMGIFTRPGEDRFDPGDPTTLDRATVGLLDGRDANALFDDFLYDNSLDAELRYYEEKEDLMDALLNGELDFVVDSATNLSPGEHYLMGLGVISARIASTSEKAELVEDFDRAVDAVRRENPDYDTMMQKEAYLQARHLVTNFTSAQSDFIRSCDVLRVVLLGNRLPYAKFGPEGAEGIYPTLFHAIAKDSGLKFEFIEAGDYGDAARMVRDGTADIFIDVYANDAFSDGFYYTNPIYMEEYAFLGKHPMESPDGPGKVALSMGVPSIVSYAQKELPGWQVDTYPSIPASLEAASNGQADFAAVDGLMLQAGHLLAQYPSLNAIPAHFLEMPMCLAIGQHQPRILQNVLNRAILRLDPNEVRRTALKYTTVAAHSISLSYLFHAYPLQSGLAVGLVLLLAAGAAFLYVHGRQARKQKEALARKNVVLMSVLNALRDSNAARDDYRHKAETDALTGALNKRAIEMFVRNALKQLPQAEGTDALFVIDLDHFKEANDTMGHQYGDDILRRFAKQVMGMVRQRDALGRFGGDEFVLYCVNAQVDHIPNIAERISQVARSLSTEEAPITASVGIAVAPRDGTEYEELFREADEALYYVKQHGRDGFAISGQMPEDADV